MYINAFFKVQYTGKLKVMTLFFKKRDTGFSVENVSLLNIKNIKNPYI
jgi:hypothetical protein